MQCSQHGIEFVLKPAGVSKRTGQPYSEFYACPTYGCKERPPRQGNYAPRANSSVTKAITSGRIEVLPRNFDREAYEKCCSIWIAASLTGRPDVTPNFQLYWDLFQAIRADGEKRFATGWAKAEAVFKQAPSDDYEQGNKSIEEVQAQDAVEGIEW